MKAVSRTIIIRSDPGEVFAFMDAMANTGMHMTRSSMPMWGGKLELIQISPHATGPGAKFRWKGKALWMKLDFTVEVTAWKKNELKIWETTGEVKAIILSWYRMRMQLTPVNEGTQVELGIEYETSGKNFFERILAFFIAGWYARWCVINMLNDSKKKMESI